MFTYRLKSIQNTFLFLLEMHLYAQQVNHMLFKKKLQKRKKKCTH